MKKVFLLTIALTAFTFCYAQDYNDFLDKLENYQKQVRIKMVGMHKAHLDPATFNSQKYLALFPALKPESLYHVDCYYFFTSLAGMPIWYAFSENEIESIKQKSKLFYKRKNLKKWIMDRNDEKVGGSLKPLIKEIRKSRKYYWKLDSANRAIPHLVPEDNEMGYFQLLVFSQFGDRFALYWHAGSGARKIIRKRQQLEELITANRERKFDVNFDEEQILPYLEQDLAP